MRHLVEPPRAAGISCNKKNSTKRSANDCNMDAAKLPRQQLPLGCLSFLGPHGGAGDFVVAEFAKVVDWSDYEVGALLWIHRSLPCSNRLKGRP